MAEHSNPNKVAPGRECGACTLCCKLMAIEALNKPKGEECPNCIPNVACRIYDTRPGECRSYYCEFLKQGNLPDYWHPRLCHIVLTFDRSRNRLSAYVDPVAEQAWRQEPHYSDLKQWAAGMAGQRGQVVVKIGPRAVVILPDRHVDLGIVAADEVIVTAEKQTPDGLVLDALKMKLDDPRIADLQDSALGAHDLDVMGRSEP